MGRGRASWAKGSASTEEMHEACASQYGCNKEERGVDGDGVHEVDPVMRALTGHEDIFSP